MFKLTPPAVGSTAWTETILHSFNGTNSFTRTFGANPTAGLMVDDTGNLYGTTSTGGEILSPCPSNGCGIAFKLTPPAAAQTTWSETVLHSFNGASGRNPSTGLISDAAGNLYGATSKGGLLSDCYGAGCGVVFELTPPAAGKTAWTKTILHVFNGTNGAYPGELVFDAAGNLYGSTGGGGAYGAGTVFKLTPPAAGKTGWTETVPRAFNGANGRNPQGRLIFDAAGNLYGTTAGGGKTGYGTVFRLTPPAAGKNTWTGTVLRFFNGTNGAYPGAGLIFDAAGNLYGTTYAGGMFGSGTVFKLTPPAAGKTAWTETVLHSFNGNNGRYPIGNLVFDKAGNLYGTTQIGGKHGSGAIFKLTP